MRALRALGVLGRFRLVRAVESAAASYGGHYCPQMAAAISYHVLFSLFPLAIFLVSVFGLVLQDEDRRHEIVNWIVDNLLLSASGSTRLDQAVSGLANPVSAVGLVALVGVLWSASGMMGAMRNALTAIWGGERRPYVYGKLFDLVLVVLAGVLVLVAFGLTLLVRLVRNVADELGSALGLEALGSTAAQLTQTLVSLAILFTTIVLLYRFVPPVRPRFRDLWPAALLASIALQVTTAGYAFYLSEFASYNLVYGSLGAVIGFLFLVYLAATIFLFGAEVAAAWPRAARAST